MSSCAINGACSRKEMDNMNYPTDMDSLYANKNYDRQTAQRRCYEKSPFNIIEGFCSGSFWNRLIKLIILALFILLLIILVKDFVMPKETVSLGTKTVSEFDNSSIKLN